MQALIWNEHTGHWQNIGEWNGVGSYALLNDLGETIELHIDLRQRPTCPVCNELRSHKLACPRPRPTSFSKEPII